MKIIKIKDYYGNYQEVPVDDALYDEWRKLNNETQRVYRKEMYHRSCFTIEEAEDVKATENIETVVRELIRQEENARLYEAISKLTPIQQRRVRMFMDHMSYTDIAQAEGVKFAPLYRSLHAAFNKLRIFMSDYEE